MLGRLDLLALIMDRNMVRLVFLKDLYPLSGGWIREELCGQGDALKMLVVKIWAILCDWGRGGNSQCLEVFKLDD